MIEKPGNNKKNSNNFKQDKENRAHKRSWFDHTGDVISGFLLGDNKSFQKQDKKNGYS